MGRKNKGKRSQSKAGASASGSQASARGTRASATSMETSEEKDSTIQKGEESATNVTADQKRKTKSKKKEQSDLQPEIDVGKAISTMELRSKGEKSSHRKTPVLSKLETASAVRAENVALKRSTATCYLTRASPATSETVYTPLSEMLQRSKRKGTIKQKSALSLKTSNIQQELSSSPAIESVEPDPNIVFDESTHPLFGSKDIDERRERMRLRTSEIQRGIVPEKEREELIIEESEETINLKKDVNLRFEYGTDSKKVFVDDKIFYAVNEKHKLTFNIDEGDMQLSFVGSNASIYTQKSKIDCSVQDNQIIFSIKDRSAQLDSLPEDLNALRLTESEDESAFKDFGISDIAGAVGGDFIPSELYPESSSETIDKSTSETISSSPEKYVQKCLQNVTEDFLTSVRTSCKNFEIRFLEFLKESQDTHEE